MSPEGWGLGGPSSTSSRSPRNTNQCACSLGAGGATPPSKSSGVLNGISIMGRIIGRGFDIISRSPAFISPFQLQAMTPSASERELADALRALAMDAVEAAKSGHPGMPMGMAEIALALWQRHHTHNPANPAWPNRDRFVLSNGHG